MGKIYINVKKTATSPKWLYHFISSPPLISPVLVLWLCFLSWNLKLHRKVAVGDPFLPIPNRQCMNVHCSSDILAWVWFFLHTKQTIYAWISHEILKILLVNILMDSLDECVFFPLFLLLYLIFSREQLFLASPEDLEGVFRSSPSKFLRNPMLTES